MPSGRIMIVEDESLVAEDLHSCLSRAGYEVVGIADNFDAARALAVAARPDLALLDIRLKGSRDGIELAAALREQAVGFVYLTSHGDDGTLARAERTEPLGYVLKPFGARELFPVLQTALYRHAAEQRLRGMEKWLQTTLRSIGDGVVATDSTGLVTFMNPMAERMSQRELREASGCALTEVLPLRDNVTGEQLPCMATRAMRHGGTVHLDPGTDLLRPDGSILPVDDSAAPVRDEGGEITGAVLVLQDATPRRQLEQRRREAEHRMQSAARLESLGALAGGLAHDLNNILTTILGGVELCRGDSQRGEPAPLQQIESAARQASELCKRLLAGAGAAPVSVQQVELEPVVREVVVAARSLHATAVLTVHEERPALAVAADPAQLQQVLSNLVRNALEALAGRDGNVAIRWGKLALPSRFVAAGSCARSLPPGAYIWIEVADDGPGMPQDVLERVFEPFFTTKLSGRGLGLASVHGIVRRHGGAVEAASEIGVGTCFRLYWPAAEELPGGGLSSGVATAVPAAAADHSPTAAKQAGAEPAAPAGLVLLVDDNAAVRRTCAQVLAALGWHCQQADSGEAALAMLGAGMLPDVVILDRMMPGLSGDEVLVSLRRLRCDLPVLLISGGAWPTEGEIQDDYIGFLSKPFLAEDLQAELVRLCGRSRFLADGGAGNTG